MNSHNNRIARRRTKQAQDREGEQRENQRAADEIYRLARTLPPGSNETRALFRRAAKSYNGQMSKNDLIKHVFTPGRWNKKAGEPAAHYVTGLGRVEIACGAELTGWWDEWKVHVDLGKVPLCEACKAKVHA